MSGVSGVRGVRWMISIGLLVGVSLYLRTLAHEEGVPIRKPLAELPAAIGRWQARETTALDDEVLALLRPSDYLVRRYADAKGRSISLYVGYWKSQRKGVQIHSPKHCLPGGGWEPLEAGRLAIALPGRRGELEVNKYVLQKDADRQVVFYWFQSQGVPRAGEVEAKIELVKNAMLHNRSDGAIIRVSSLVAGSVAETSDQLAEFVREMYPALDQALPHSADSES